MIGPSHRYETSKEVGNDDTNTTVMIQLAGLPSPGPFLGATIHIDDVVRTHLDVLDERFKGHDSFILSSNSPDGTVYSDALQFAKDKYPDLSTKYSLPMNGTLPTVPLRLDASKAEQAFGKFKPFEAQVLDLVAQYVALRDKEEQ